MFRGINGQHILLFVTLIFFSAEALVAEQVVRAVALAISAMMPVFWLAVRLNPHLEDKNGGTAPDKDTPR